MLSQIKQIKELSDETKKTWLAVDKNGIHTVEGPGSWLTVPIQIYDLFNYFTYEIQILMQVLDLREIENTYDIAKYSFSVMERLIIHIKKKAEN